MHSFIQEKSKEGSSLEAEVLKGLQAQIASLAQRDELKKVGAVRPYPPSLSARSGFYRLMIAWNDASKRAQAVVLN